jgi:hypothetical protein
MAEAIIQVEAEIVNGGPEIKITHCIGVGTLVPGEVSPGKKEIGFVEVAVVDKGGYIHFITKGSEGRGVIIVLDIPEIIQNANAKSYHRFIDRVDIFHFLVKKPVEFIVLPFQAGE